jgi:hypothetical protein
MARTNVTYGRLGEVLRSYGFVCHRLDDSPPALHYVHAPTGALVSVPPYPDTDPVYPHHLVAARTTLDLYGIANPYDFDARLHKAG